MSSSSSSVCSSDVDFIVDTRIPISLRRDIDRFAIFINRLRSSLDFSNSIPDGDSVCVNVHAALEMVNDSLRDIFKHPQFKTNNVILHSLKLVQAVKDLKFDSVNVDTSRVLTIIDNLETVILNTVLSFSNRHVATTTPHLPQRSLTLGGRWKKQNSSETPKSPSRASVTLSRRHSTCQQSEMDEKENVCDIDRILYSREDGLDIAFERTKAWSTYCKDVVAFVRARLQLEQDHSRKVHTLIDSSRRDICKPFMPLREVLENSLDAELEVVSITKDTTDRLKDRVVEALDARRKEHDTTRTTLKLEWSKAMKSLNEAEDVYEKSKISLRQREDGLKKAREQCLRTESSPAEREASRRRRDQEKRSRAVEEAILKKEEAERVVAACTVDLRRKRKEVDKLKETLIEKLRDLIFQCEQTTKACTAHYFKSLATLWVRLPEAFQNLADATREYEPGAEYMAYLNTLPNRASSAASLVRSDRSIDEGVASCDGSSSLTSLRRNALNPDDEGALPDTKRHKKTSYAGRVFESSELSAAAASHRIQRTVQPSKCQACDTLSILYTIQCDQCSGFWHKNCFPRITTVCGQPVRVTDRRTSIFGVPLKGHLETENRLIPLIIEKSVEQLQRRGLRIKGIYRTCGVKSKIEEICEAFERSSNAEEVDLDDVHPINLASVVKLYLRKLPEPLLTFDLYDNFVHIGTASCSNSNPDEEEARVEELKRIISKLPLHNYETLKFLLIHLNRVSWFEDANLMGPTNLSTVIAPSLIWPPQTRDHNTAILQAQYTNKAVELMIKHAFNMFGLDRQTEWHKFFSRYSIEEPEKEEAEEDAGNESDVEDQLDEDIVEDNLTDDEAESFIRRTTITDGRKLHQTMSLPQSKLADIRKKPVERTESSGDERFLRKFTDKRKPTVGYTTSIVISSNGGSEESIEDAKCHVYDRPASSTREMKKESSSNNEDSPLGSSFCTELDPFPGSDQDVSYV